MAYIMGNIPYQKVLVRGEYLRNLTTGYGQFVPAVAYGVRAVRGSSLWFQCALGAPYGGCHFLLPIIALCNEPCAAPTSIREVQPFDCFSDTFGVVEFDFVARGEAYVLPGRRPAQYLFTIDWTASDLADDMDQHKHLHVVRRADGLIGAYANNRLLMPDAAFWPAMTQDRPDFQSLDGEFRAEGNQELFMHPSERDGRVSSIAQAVEDLLMQHYPASAGEDGRHKVSGAQDPSAQEPAGRPFSMEEA
jgi:hypothetical protein